MPTIAKTKKYSRLVMRHLELIRLYASMSELRLHTNIAVDPDLAKYYSNRAINQYSGFFAPAIESMRRSFYVSLKSFVGAYYDNSSKKVKCTKMDASSLAQYLYDGKRKSRKSNAVKKFESLVIGNKAELALLKNLRDSISHFEKKATTNNLIIFGELKTIELINGLGDVLYLLGYHLGNKPHHFSYNNEYAKEIASMIDMILGDDEDKAANREKYVIKRAEWIGR